MGVIIVGGVIEKDGKFLLVQEAKEKCRGKWNIPAGHLDPNETIFEGAKREVFEECGCRVEISGILQIGNKLVPDNAWVSVIFSTKLIEDNIKFDTDEILDVKWFTYEEIMNMKGFPSFRINSMLLVEKNALISWLERNKGKNMIT